MTSFPSFEDMDRSCSTLAWKLRLPEMDGHHLVFNELLLSPYVEPPAHQREEWPAPQIIRAEEKYKVEEIINHRKCGQGYQYLVKWKDYPLNEHMWEPAQHLVTKKILDKYQEEHNICGWLPVFAAGHWDKLLHQYKTKEEDISRPYLKKGLFVPEMGVFININEDIDPT
jgi:hypothetical protein